MVRTGDITAHWLGETGLFSEDQIRLILERRRTEGESLAQAVTALGLADEEDFLEALAGAMGLTFLRLRDRKLDEDLLSRLPARAAVQYHVVPVGAEEDLLRVATHTPLKPGLIDALRLATESRIELALCPSPDLAQAIKAFYGVGAETMQSMMEEDRIEVTAEEPLLKQDLSELDQEASVVKFVNQIIWEALQERATDIHLEPMENDLRIRYRIDGVLHQTPVPPQIKQFQSAIISRIKVMSNMDIAEKRLPQDGRISLRVRSEDLDVRVSTMPTVYGESVSLRLLQRGGSMIRMSELGLDDRNEELLNRLIHRPHGILLVTGPTGSGKSTSLYAWLHTINSVDQRIITVEDPIEYEMAGINQIQIRPEIGLTFARGLRHILRQDPDVIMVGEIRDKETAEIAIRAALTGHLVFSTLHTNDSAGAVTRLLDMGIEPFLVASSVEAIVAQRLVRTLCPHCRRPWTGERSMLEREGFPVDRLSDHTIYEAAGCEACLHTGFLGRAGIFEVLPITERVRPLIVDRASAARIKSSAGREGLKSLRHDGWEKVLEGKTTIEEVLRVTEEDEALAGN
ncbi:GspE/PulE family protein [Kiritimatiella glycovorans]|uniref:Type II secretion system protein E n=1 Tax=Kiritimatiella glycovorans TaxID=1307763 RepID=A0A0G3EHJ8_9BACT|nr:GspE/PulE family protein [Kiritimatiella glycovorans]AKJ64887.1 Type II secretion system protein E [Kiritimatiella glycovorans]